MKNMNPIFSLKNFRSFDEDGANFELAPITVLTGRNSAGKSSLVKALMLLSDQSTGADMVKGILDNNRHQPSSVLITTSSELKLGGFTSVINEQTPDGSLSLSYRIWSEYLREEVVCKRTFRKKKGVLNEGVLSVFTIEKTNGDIIYKAIPETYLECFNFGGKFEECEVEHLEEEEHFELIEDNYRQFVLACLYHKYSKSINDEEKSSKKMDDAEKRQVEEYKRQQKELQKQMGTVLPEDYDERIIEQWNSKYWNTLFKSDFLERKYLRNRTDEEREKDDKDLFTTLVINEIVNPWFLKSMVSIDSSTNEIQRAYNVESHDKFSKLLNAFIQSQSSSSYKSGSFTNKWLQRFHIGDSIEIVGTDEGLGVKAYLEKNGKKMLLADEGYGITQLISILLQIELIIKKHRYYDEMNDKFYNLPHVICIEEPEVHLHPEYQSWLAEMFVEAYQNHDTHFIIETHSEYLIRKLQVMVADKENKLTPNDVSLNYVEKDENGISHNRQIKIQEDGFLGDSFGPGFFDEATDLSLGLYKIKMGEL